MFYGQKQFYRRVIILQTSVTIGASYDGLKIESVGW